MSNVEVMNSARREPLCRTVYFKKRLSKAKPHFDILRFDIRHSAVRCSGHLTPDTFKCKLSFGRPMAGYRPARFLALFFAGG